VTGLFRTGLTIAALLEQGGRWLTANEAVAYSDDEPPQPMAGLGSGPAGTGEGGGGGGGCFIDTAGYR